uniref:Nematode cuticle collagen N-terminal domain-containing protein n=1 Tax=Plectus sambesii TaxID=2011161 RepID=A0A914WAP1_9BILA
MDSLHKDQSNINSEEQRQMRRIAFVAVVVSTLAVVSTVISLPLLYNYVQSFQSHLIVEADFCKMRTAQMWLEVTKLQANSPGGTALRYKRSWLFGQWVPDSGTGGGADESYGNQSPPVPSEQHSTGPGPAPTNPPDTTEPKGQSSSPQPATSVAPELPVISPTGSEGCCTCQQGPAGPPGQPGPDGSAGKDGKNGAEGKPGKDSQAAKTTAKAIEQCPCMPAPPGPPGTMGPKGPSGPKGEPSPRAHDGKPGQHGMPGPAGPAGRPGRDGPKGPRGAPGKVKYNPGPAGPAGRPGTPGPAGPKGAPGPDAKDVANGQSGEAGESGRPGSVGRPGAVGPKGPRGPPGPEGACDHCPAPRLPPGY